jgi:hypothetical protein
MRLSPVISALFNAKATHRFGKFLIFSSVVPLNTELNLNTLLSIKYVIDTKLGLSLNRCFSVTKLIDWLNQLVDLEDCHDRDRFF